MQRRVSVCVAGKDEGTFELNNLGDEFSMPMVRSHVQHRAVVLFHVSHLQPQFSLFHQPQKSWNVVLNDRNEDGLHACIFPQEHLLPKAKV